MDTITLNEVELFLHVGVPDEERSAPQRLLVTVVLELETGPAAARDDLALTVDYFELYQRLRGLGKDREWRLIETLAQDIAALALGNSRVRRVHVEVQKFILPGTRNVAVRITREPSGGESG